jgi:hypothetical protein
LVGVRGRVGDRCLGLVGGGPLGRVNVLLLVLRGGAFKPGPKDPEVKVDEPRCVWMFGLEPIGAPVGRKGGGGVELVD